MGDWLWILVLVFFLFRLLAKAGKKAGKAPPGEAGPPGREPETERAGLDELQQFLGKLSGRPPPRPVIPPPPRIPRQAATAERKPRIRPSRLKKPPAPPPVSPQTPPPPAPKAVFRKEEKETREKWLTFSTHPLLQGIIFSEIIGPPKSERPGTGIPSDLNR